MEILSRPSWAGFMEEVTKTSGLYAVSSVHALPFINLDPTKPSAIYSALMFAADKCKKNDKAWCIVTLIRSAIVSKSFRNCCCITNKPWECDGEDRWFPPVDILYKCSWQHHVRHWTGGTAEQVICSVVCIPHMVKVSGHAYSQALRVNSLTQEELATILLRTEESEQEEVDGIKKGTDSIGKMMHI